MTALDKANRTRVQRAAVKHLLYAADCKADSLLLLARILAENPDVIQTATFAELLESCRRIGRVYTRKVLIDLRLSTTTQVHAMSDPRRARIVTYLKDEAMRTRGLSE